MKHTIQSTVKDGNLTRNRNQLKDIIKSFEGKNVVITIEKAKKKRSNPQNAFIWSCVYPIVQNCFKEHGNVFSINDIHDILKMKFLKEYVLINEDTGECIERTKSTTELSTLEFMEYIQEIQKLTEEWFGVVIPEPGKQLKIE